MYNFLMQIFLAARGNKSKGESLMQILVFVGMATFWIVGAIIKARGNKIKDSDFPEEESEKQEAPKPVAQRRISKPIQKAAAMPTQRKVVGEKSSVELKSSELGKWELGKSAVKTVKLPKIGDVKEAVVKSRVKELVGDFGEAGKLERAILYSEILGKPLALRRGSESILGLG